MNSLVLSGAITSLVVLINYLLPQKAFGLLMALVVATLLLNWIMICLAHLRFRAAMRAKVATRSSGRCCTLPGTTCALLFWR
ncbi:phenylalanine transporter [Citrobacter koseri]|uniref:Phenylalanine transporter n=1 Tax=Citrobacter koseri TaxID=545 RepID=A0A2X2X5G4_CITKO|nr:phenylalanine transporter [Citrobacter koseri]